MNKTIICLIIILLVFSNAFGGRRDVVCRFEEIRFENGSLLFNFYSDNIINKKLLEGLRNGLTATLEYKIQLWKKNRYWPDSIEKESLRRIKISYDTWQKSFVVKEYDSEPKYFTADEISVNCSTLNNFKIADTKSLSQGREYRIIVRVVLKKISLENYEEIKRWLEGRTEDFNIKKIKAAKSSGKRATNWFFNLLLNVTGFGDDVIVSKSRWFKAPEYDTTGNNPK